MTVSPFLSVPVCGLVSSSGLLLEADFGLLQLQFDAGGDEQGPLAIPGLRKLAAIVTQTAMRIERRVRVADLENDIDLWVEAAPRGDAISLKISGWRERQAGEPETAETSANLPDLVLNEQFLVVGAPGIAEPASELIGLHFASIFEPVERGGGDLPMLDVLVRHERIENILVKRVGTAMLFKLTLDPVLGDDQRFLGYSCNIDAIVPSEAPQGPASEGTNIGFGRQFAPILRQPLSRIIANAETIQSRLRGPLRESYAGYAQDIANAARHLSELVSDLEDLEAIDRPDFVVAADSVDLVDIARRVSGLLALKASDNQMDIHVDAQVEPTLVVGEFRRVLQIVLNLATNAIRYGPGGSTVAITTGIHGGQGWIEVADQGAGIDNADADRIFEKFERLGRTGDGGSGLGLYISRRLARFMHGDLALMPSAGQGTRFRLTLPAKTA